MRSERESEIRKSLEVGGRCAGLLYDQTRKSLEPLAIIGAQKIIAEMVRKRK